MMVQLRLPEHKVEEADRAKFRDDFSVRSVSEQEISEQLFEEERLELTMYENKMHTSRMEVDEQ